MASLILIAVIPVALAVAAMVVPVRALRAAAPVLVWLQLGVLAYIVAPVMSRAHWQLPLVFDFKIDQLGALFMLLSTIVVASCLSHAVHYFNAETHELEAR